ncbi:MAG: hypothetical protein ACUVS1_11540 [Actinomycetota bacterium]
MPDLEAARVRAAALAPEAWQAAEADGAHHIFVVDHAPVPSPSDPHHPGVRGLIRLMWEGGLDFYRSDKYCPGAGTDGIIAPDDVVLIKVNAAWDQRGMTNTDLVKGLITAILEHPDGFTGEVVLVENCEGGPDYTQRYNNAENIYQSFQAVVDSFGVPSRVSASSWWSFTGNAAHEFDSGDYRQGYVILGDNVSYPKFITGRGTCISLGRGSGPGVDTIRVG